MTSADWLEGRALVILPLCVALLSVCIFVSEVTKTSTATPVKRTQNVTFRVQPLCMIHSVTLHVVFPPSDPPDDAPSCSVEPALNHTSLRLLCAWPGGFPSPSLWWTGDLIRPLRDAPDTRVQTNAATLLLGEGLTSNNSLFTCTGSHRALEQATACSVRTCEKKKKKKKKDSLFHFLFFKSLICHLPSCSRRPPC